MKRKLDSNDAPSTEGLEPRQAKGSAFESFGLDARLLQAIAREKFSKPTLVQVQAIPQALAGKDILARAKTGSGKTAAYALPILQSILRRKSSNTTHKFTSSLVLVPTRELAEQVDRAISSFAVFCRKDVRSINLTQKISDAVQRSILAELPDIVVTTPARAVANLNSSSLSLANLNHLVIDEADLILSYGYDEDIQQISKAVPRGIQTFLMSATLSTEVDTLKGLFCRSPMVLELEDKDEDDSSVSQYVVRCAEDEKFLLAYVIFKLQLIKGKCIVFVGDIDRCYRVKLFLEQFGIRSCVLNSELPVNSRIHVVQEFNKGVYDIIVAADDQEVLGEVAPSRSEARSGANFDKGMNDDQDGEIQDQLNQGEKASKEDLSDAEPAQQRQSKKLQNLAAKARDYGVSRGIDFQNVACVLNFDLPTTSSSYTHRIGRTARAGKNGMALSFVIPADLYGKHKPTKISSAKHDENVLKRIMKQQEKKGKEVKPYHFEMKQVDAFRYRMGDALRAVTRTAIQEARSRELRQELLKSEKLKKHFEDNPNDLRHLRHDGELRSARVQHHLRHVPDYLMPAKGKKGLANAELGDVTLHKNKDNRARKGRMHGRGRGRGTRGTGKKQDPLKLFNARGKR